LAAQRARGSSSLGPASHGRTLSRCLIAATDVAHKRKCSGHTDGGEPMRKFPKACMNPKHMHKCTTTAQQRIDANAAVRCPAGVPVQHTMRIPPYATGSPGLFASVDRTRTFRHPMQWDAREGSVRSPCSPNRHPTQTMQAHRAFGHSVLWQPVSKDQPGLFASVDRTRTFRHPTQWVAREGSVRPQLHTAR